MDDNQRVDAVELAKMQVQLGNRIQALRKARGWSQDTFAHLVGLSRSYPHTVERGDVDVRFSTLVRMAHVFELSLPEFLQLGDHQSDG